MEAVRCMLMMAWAPEMESPVSMFWLGTIGAERLDKELALRLHSPLFWPVIHPAIETGVRVMSAAATELLAR